MNSETRQLADLIFRSARDLPQEAIDEFLTARCSNAALRAEVEALLRQVESAVVDHDQKISAQDLGARPARIGAYRILDVLGQGGMGTVYLAEQERPIVRRVALKIIKLGMDSREVLARFSSERQALAMMTHPNIAKVFDAGWTDDGRPYFAMELVQGIAITRYCDQHSLATRERIRIFTTVCEALHHAHQKGVVHRDIKPTNVLVSVDGGGAVAHVIDFGIAKALNQRLTEATIYTQQGLLIGTPEYMSPEQALTDGTGVDTTSDVYSLGMLLYELLVGALPFDPAMLRTSGYAEIQRIICEEDPPKPSDRLHSLGEAATDIAKRRRTDAATLRRELAADLDWVILKAIDKDRTRRYQSASEFAADLSRHVNGDPVVARPASVGYRARKFLQKHRAAAAAAVIVTAAVIASLAVSITMYLRSEAAREQAQWQATLAAIAAADAQIQAGETVGPALIANAETRLASIPAADRHWEWGYLARKADPSDGVLWGATDPSVIFPDVTDSAIYEGRLSLSPSGDRLFWSTREGVHAWDMTTRRLVAAWPAYGMVRALAPDGSKLLSLNWRLDRPWRVLDTQTGDVIAQLPVDVYGIDVAAFDREGDHLATTDAAGLVRLWSTRSGQLMDTVDIAARPTFLRVTGGDSPLIVAGAGSDLHVRRANASGVTQQLRGATGTSLVAGELSRSGETIVTGDSTGAIRMWRAGSGESRLLGTHAGVSALTLSPDERLVATGSSDGRVRIWNTRQLRARDGSPVPATLEDPSHGALLNAHDNFAISALLFLPDSPFLIVASGSGVLRVWDVAKARLESGLALREIGNSPAISTILAASENGRLILGTGLDPTAIAKLGPPTTDLVQTAMSIPRVTTVLDLHSRTSMTLPRFASGATLAALSADGVRIALARADGTVLVRTDAATEPVIIMTGAPNSVRALAMDLEGRYVAVAWTDSAKSTPAGTESVGGHMGVWDVRSGRQVGTLSTDSIPNLAFDRSGGRLLVGERPRGTDCPSPGRIWDVERWRVAVEINHCSPYLAFATSGDYLASYSTSERRVRVWNSRTGTLLATSEVIANVSSLTISPDGSRIAAFMWSGRLETPSTILLIDGRTATSLVAIPHRSAVGPAQLRFTANGERLLIMSAAGAIRVIDSSGTWRTEIRALARRLDDGNAAAVPTLGVLASTRRFVSSQGRRPVDAQPTNSATSVPVLLVGELLRELERSADVDPPLREGLIEEMRRLGDWDLTALCRAGDDVVKRSDARPADYARAIEMTRVATTLAPWAASCIEVLAIAQYRAADYRGALSTIAALDRVRPEPSPPRLAIETLALHRLGRREDALAVARRLSLSPAVHDTSNSSWVNEVKALDATAD